MSILSILASNLLGSGNGSGSGSSAPAQSSAATDAPVMPSSYAPQLNQPYASPSSDSQLPPSVSPVDVGFPSNGKIGTVSTVPQQTANAPMTARLMQAQLPPVDSSTQLPPISDSSASSAGQPPPNPYDNSAAAKAVMSATNGYQRDGGDNQGAYGLLPQGLQHGTLRNILGAVGDAFLVHGGMQPEFQPRVQQRLMGQAIAGMDINDPNSVQTAVQRLASTGAPGSMEMADKIQQQAEQAALRKQYMEYNQQYHQQITGMKADTIAARYSPYAQGQIDQIRKLPPAQQGPAYQQAYAAWNQRMQKINPELTAEDVGFVDPSTWSASVPSAGLTSNNLKVSDDKQAERGVQTTNNANNNTTKVKVANIAAGGHVAAAGVSNQRPSEANFDNDYIALKKAGQPTTPEEDQRFQAHNTLKKGSGRSLAPGLSPGGAGGAGGYIRTATGVVNGKTQKMGYNGHAWVPLPGQ